jgi:putative transport protein
MIASFFFGIYAMKLRVSESFGVICGGMTFTPGLDIIRQVDSSEKPVVGYSSVYPVSLILIILVVQAADIILRMF